MYQLYFHYDPVLMQLSSATVSALESANIKCLEDLFSMDENDILDIPGIGRKRSQEILDLLNNLPFDYMDDALPNNPEQNPHAGVHPAIIENLPGQYNDELFNRGISYFRNGQVHQIDLVDESTMSYQIKVHGSQLYTVTLKLNSDHSLDHSCTCPYTTRYNFTNMFCKHQYAALLALAERQRLMLFENVGNGNYAYKQLVRRFKSAKSNLNTSGNGALAYILVQKQGQWDLFPNNIYPQVQSSSPNRYGRWSNPWENLSPANAEDRMIVSYLMDIYQTDYYGYYTKKTAKSFGDVLDLLKNRRVLLKKGKEKASEVQFRDQPFQLLLSIESTNGESNSTNETPGKNLSLNFRLYNENIEKELVDAEVICVDPCWIYDGTALSRITGSELARQFFLNTPRESVQVPAEEIESFMQEFYPTLEEAGIPIQIAEDLTTEKEIDPVPRLYLSENARQLKVTLRIAYEDFEIHHQDHRNQLLLPAKNGEQQEALLCSITRNIEKEESWVHELLETGLETTHNYRTFIPEDSALEWIVEYLPQLAESGYEIYGAQELKRYAPPKKMTSSSFNVSSGEKWFELEGEMTFGDYTVSMREIQQVLIKEKPYIRLADGSTGELPKDWLRQIKKLLHLMPSGEQKARVPKIAAPVIEEVGKAADHYTTDQTFADYADRIRDFDRIKPVETPHKLNGTLRSYQQAGLSWLYFLHEYGLGGILADDMGLGKTVQVLSLLSIVHEETGKRPKTLVIAPLSVIQNWEMEANRFIPDFSVYIHHGTDRMESADQWPDADIGITTYGTMRNDIDLLKNITFDYIVLDESHTIRNPSSKTSRVIRKLQAEHRLCLTGTPVQNTSMDLWAQFEFLNPGLLGRQKQFREQWVKPVEENKDATAEEMLHKMVSPFILRRTKQKVAKDLPPITISQVDCSMDPTQQQVYEKYRQVYYQMVNDAIDENGINDSRFTVLEGLTRLRQICCSPRLIEGEKGASSKLTRFTELASELIQEGHRALVFSQFVGFLKRIEAEVKEQGWEYEYLDGQTRNRQERVDRFQSDSSKNLFLISLKAGGEGLNLTAADYVFLMDPWWNPAAERQAMDRTHRIGQNEHVFVYRFVCPGTVEEKILRLQERKKDLAEKLVVAEAGIFKELQRDDLLSLFE